jgi:hypothetical protein
MVFQRSRAGCGRLSATRRGQLGLGAVLVASFAMLASGSVAAAAPTTDGGTIHLFVTPGQHQGEGTILIAGAIGDYGRTTGLNKKGIGTAVLRKGTFKVDLSIVNKRSNSAAPTLVDKATCSFIFTVSGPVKIMDGTGLYKGISGTVGITETFAGIGPLYKSGAKKGQCNTSNSANPLAQWGEVTGSGTVSYE